MARSVMQGNRSVYCAPLGNLHQGHTHAVNNVKLVIGARQEQLVVSNAQKVDIANKLGNLVV